MSHSQSAQGGVFVALGSNLNNPEQQVRRAIEALNELPHTRVLAASDLYLSAAVGLPGEHPDFVNAVCEVRTGLEPHALLEALHALERRLGRMRATVPGSRVIDLDLLLYGDREIHDNVLTVPHPRMHLRAFVLQPLHQIAPGARVPGRGSVATLLETVRDQRIAAFHAG